MWCDWPFTEPAGVLYIDGHVRVYHGHQTQRPKHHQREINLCLRATTDYWVNAMAGQPFMVVNKVVDPGLIKVIENDILPELEARVPIQATSTTAAAKPFPHQFTLIFDHEDYSPDLMVRMKARQVAILTYHQYPGDNGSETEFNEHLLTLPTGQQRLSSWQNGGCLGHKLWVREIRNIDVQDLPEDQKFKQLSTQSKHLIDTIKMTAYRAETAMANSLRDTLSHPDEARTLLRARYQTEADLFPDLEKQILTIRLHHLANVMSDKVIEKFCTELNATGPRFPRTNLRMVFKVGSI